MAANRLNLALRNAGIESTMLVQEAYTDSEYVVQAGSGNLYKFKAFARFMFEWLKFFPYERNSILKFVFSPANKGLDITVHPLVREADIIHLHWINQGYLSLKTLQKLFNLGKPVVWTLHDMWPFTGGCHYSGTCLEFLEKCSFCPYLSKPAKDDLAAKQFSKKRKLYHDADIHLVACSKWMKAQASESALFRHKEIIAIPNPIDVDVFKPIDKKEARTKLGLPKNKKLLLFGTMDSSDMRKGARYLFEALNTLVENFPVFREKVEVVVFGKIHKSFYAGVPLKIHNLKFVSDTQKFVEIYNAADIFVLPSLQVNLPNTVMESLACGTPVVAFSSGGLTEMIKHKHSGFIAESKNALSLSTGIYESLFMDDLEQMGKNAREKVLKEYANDIVARQYVEMYKNVM